MKRFIKRNRKIFDFIIRLILGLVFIYASFHKIIDSKSFSEVLSSYVLIPDFLVNMIAIVFPWFEIILGLFFILGIFKKTVSYLIGFTLIIFIIMLSVNLLLGVDFSCGCFSNEIKTTTENIFTLFRDLILFFILIFYYYLNRQS